MFSFENSTREIAEAGIETAIISVGATEQCGPYLPVHIDTFVTIFVIPEMTWFIG